MPLVAVLFPPRKKIVPFHAETRAAKISEQRLPTAAHIAPRARLGERRGPATDGFDGGISAHGNTGAHGMTRPAKLFADAAFAGADELDEVFHFRQRGQFTFNFRQRIRNGETFAE